MALTYSTVHSGVVGTQRIWQGLITFDASYPTGGEAIDVDQLGGMFQLDALILNQSSVAGKDVVWDQATAKLLIYVEDGTSGIAAQAANASNQSAVTVRAVAFGR